MLTQETIQEDVRMATVQDYLWTQINSLTFSSVETQSL